eukprot:m.254236 g.254236  ORF g.254236 m.254236 type:complete len:50 (+) comp16168_c0_seq11:609-758(+)
MMRLLQNTTTITTNKGALPPTTVVACPWIQFIDYETKTLCCNELYFILP